MNKERVAELLDNYVQGINGKFKVEESSEDLDLLVKDDLFASFVNFKITRFCILGQTDQDALIAKTGIIQKFYIKACELLEKLDEKKYTIQIFDNNNSFLYKLSDDKVGDLSIGWLADCDNNLYFTKSEIKELKQCQDVAIDWDKAIIKEVEE